MGDGVALIIFALGITIGVITTILAYPESEMDKNFRQNIMNVFLSFHGIKIVHILL